MWSQFKVELRASPDTPIEEAFAKRQGRVLGPQTVVYHIYGNDAEHAVARAIEIEKCFLYRIEVSLFEVQQIKE